MSWQLGMPCNPSFLLYYAVVSIRLECRIFVLLRNDYFQMSVFGLLLLKSNSLPFFGVKNFFPFILVGWSAKFFYNILLKIDHFLLKFEWVY